MRFAHLSDTHLGHRQLGIFEREEDFYEMFDSTVDKIIESGVDFVIHSGDLFDSARPSTNALLCFQKALIKLNNVGIPIYAIAGNHDTVLRKNVKPPIDLFEELGLNIIRPRDEIVIGDILICGVQYVPKSQKTALDNILEMLSQKADKYPKSVLVLHQGIEKFLPEEASELKMNELPDNFTYYAMGHLHDYFNEEYGNGNLVYPGSMEMYKMNQNYEKFGKGFCIVDMSGEKPEIERVSVEIQRKQYEKSINYNNFAQELDEFKSEIEKLDKKPMVSLHIVGGDFDSAVIYKKIQDKIGEYILNLRPFFKPDCVLAEERKIDKTKHLDPKVYLAKVVDEKYSDKQITDLSVDLFENLSGGKTEEAKYLSDNYFKEKYSFEEL